jgi:protein-tyrosine phosphatase
VFHWFKKKQVLPTESLHVDLHSHLLPGLDDGVKTFEEAEELILHFKKLGYNKLITTPHVMSDAYQNTEYGIRSKTEELKQHLLSRNIAMEIVGAAEYYLDESLIHKLNTNQPLLTMAGKYFLFETNFLNEPLNLKEFIFLATTKGYKPVLAHPERYLYLQNNLEKAEDLINRGVLFQINVSSLTGYYSKSSQQTASKLIDKGWIHFLGSDCHHLQHVKLLHEAQGLKSFQKALTLNLLNNSLQ